MNDRMKRIVTGAAPLVIVAGTVHLQADAADPVRSNSPQRAAPPATQPATQPTPAQTPPATPADGAPVFVFGIRR